MSKFKELFLVLFLILISSFFRFYNLEKRAVFFADEERDAYVVYKTIIKDHHLTLIGPSTSVGNIYLGPAWYYFLLPWYFIFSGDQIVAPIAVSFIGVLTTVLFYLFGREIFDKRVGFIAAVIYASSDYLIRITNRAWNPSLIPITSLIFLYSLWKIKNGNQNYWWLTILCLGLGIQFHLTAFLFFPALIVFLVIYKIKISPKLLALGSLFLVLLLSPSILFDLRHNFWNCKAVFEFIKNLLSGGKFGEQKIVINPYYSLIFYPAIIFLISFIVNKINTINPWPQNICVIFRRGVTGALFILLLAFFLLFNFSEVLKDENKLSLFYKKRAVKYAIEKVGNKKFKLEIFGPKDFQYGFRYLFYFYNKEPEESPVDFSYRHFYRPSKQKAVKIVYISDNPQFFKQRLSTELNYFGGIIVGVSD